ncbi:MAG: RDD family protein [Campylobacteraceae bacterium]|nr:RDD family protein [Campylobacteraceae bacterium]
MAKQKGVIAPISSRIKAFILDIFLLAMPLLYFTTYVVLGTKEEFQSNQLAVFIVWIVYGIITTLFFVKSAQTPGYRSQNIYLIDLKTGKKAKFEKVFLRYILFILGSTFIVGVVMCFFRKDKLNLHDFITGTAPLLKTNG